MPARSGPRHRRPVRARSAGPFRRPRPPAHSGVAPPSAGQNPFRRIAPPPRVACRRLGSGPRQATPSVAPESTPFLAPTVATPSRRTAVPPNRRPAEPPSRRTAVPPRVGRDGDRRRVRRARRGRGEGA
ncbi:hypothetical protein E1211_22355 [Micromonospora sp. 15K316]|nr:hypothetical protein E1211_22355 [Micromonospora sp. 15K316]